MNRSNPKAKQQAKRMQTQQEQELGRAFIALPASIIQYCMSFIVSTHPNHHGCDAILITYKAFACLQGEEETDPLWDYKKNVQRYLADFVYADVLPELTRWHSVNSERPVSVIGFTDQEIMYFYDLIFCNTDILIYGSENADEATVNRIEMEFNDCNYYAASICDNYDDALSILSSLPVIRLLEAALFYPEGEMLNYILECGFYHPAMLIYIYIKYNHHVHGSGYGARSLAANATLLQLLMKEEDPDTRVRLLETAIGGRRMLYTQNENELTNGVLPNLALVKTILPAYINPNERMNCHFGQLRHYYDMSFCGTVTPLDYWREYANHQFFGALKDMKEIISPRDEQIGAYLQEITTV
jgi:hypothetical protein